MKFVSSFLFVMFLALNSFALPSGIEFEDVAGKKVVLETSKNKRLVVFWATWCSECKGKLKTILPELDQNPKVSVVTVNMDEERERAQDFVEKNKVQVPVIRDPSGALRTALNINAVPFWAVYERANSKDAWKLQKAGSAFKLEEVKQALGI